MIRSITVFCTVFCAVFRITQLSPSVNILNYAKVYQTVAKAKNVPTLKSKKKQHLPAQNFSLIAL